MPQFLLSTAPTGVLTNIVFWVVLIALSWLWACQFIQVMLMSDHDFPGRYDKKIWIAAFLLVAVAAPFAFLGWKSAFLEQLRTERTDLAEQPRSKSPSSTAKVNGLNVP